MRSHEKNATYSRISKIMNKNNYVSTFILCVLVLLVGGCTDRKVLPGIPSEIQGDWVGLYSDPEILLIINKGMINVIIREYPSFLCRAEEIVSYKAGWVFKVKRVAVICDKESTDIDQKEFGIIAPDNYRKTIYLSVPNELGEITASHTKYMSKGWSGSEGTYKWDLDDFYKK